MSKFKAGDLALVIGSLGNNPQVIGMAVTLVKRCQTGDGPAWWFEGSPSLVGSLERHLMPLRGDFTPEQSKQQERHVNA